MPSLPKIWVFRKNAPDLVEAKSYEAYANARSIEAIPDEQLSDLDARGELIRRALARQEVYAYRPAHQQDWVVWIREGPPSQEMRHYPAEWALKWHAEGEPRP
jgi:hypothetical protein